MLTDPDLMPFEPPPRLRVWRAVRGNFVESFPRSTYEQGVTWITLPHNAMLLLCDPDLIREMLIEKDGEIGRDAFFHRVFTPVLGRPSVMVAEGTEWRWKRSAVASTFRPDALLSFVPVCAGHAARRVECWRDVPADVAIDVATAMRETTFAIIVDAMLGNPVDLDATAYDRALSEAVETVPWQNLLTMFSSPSWTPYPGRQRVIRARDYLHREVGRIVAERRVTRAARPDLLEMLMRARDPDTGLAMTDSELTSNLVTFINTGYEVSAIALTWALWLVAKDEATQQRIVDETRACLGEKAIQASDLEGLAFTRQVIQEAMRLFPPAPILLRQAKIDTTLGAHRLKAGTHINVPIFSLHRNVGLWEHPNAFDPDRFAPDQAKARPRFAYLPFGAGPRGCIGGGFAMIETVVVLATLVRAFRFRPVPGHSPKPVARVTLRVKGSLPLFIERR